MSQPQIFFSVTPFELTHNVVSTTALEYQQYLDPDNRNRFLAWEPEGQTEVQVSPDMLRHFQLIFQPDDDTDADSDGPKRKKNRVIRTTPWIIKARTKQEVGVFDDTVKAAVIRDIVANGIPVGHLENEIKYAFQTTEYLFEPEILAASVDLTRFASDEQAARESISHKLNMCEHAIAIPAIDVTRRRPTIFMAKHKSASQLYNCMRDYYFKYIECRNTLLINIQEYDFEGKNDPYTTFYQKVYGLNLTQDFFWAKIHCSERILLY